MQVTVVTPSHNAADILERTVYSVAAQTSPVFEHIIIDDGSRDGTRELVERLREQFPHISYVYQRHRGASAARNLGIEAARGKYIAFLDSDDIWLPQKIEKQITFMEAEQVAFSYGAYTERALYQETFNRDYVPPARITHKDLMTRCPVGCLTAAYNQEALGKVYMPLVRRGQDWGLWLKLAKQAGEGRRYPGTEAVYFKGSRTLSSNKWLKAMDIYSIYRQQEALNHLQATSCLLRLSFSALTR